MNEIVFSILKNFMLVDLEFVGERIIRFSIDLWDERNFEKFLLFVDWYEEKEFVEIVDVVVVDIEEEKIKVFGELKGVIEFIELLK